MINFTPSPIFISFGPLTIRWYGLILALALTVGVFVMIKLAKYKNIDADAVYDAVFWSALFAIVGARLYEVLFINFSYYLANPSAIYKIWQGGIAIHGAIIGGLIGLLIFCKRKKINFWPMASIIVVGLSLGQAIGRWGNFFNQELFGWPTNLPWGLYIDKINRPLEYVSQNYFHPTFLYESLANLLLFGLLLFVFFKFKNEKIIVSLYLIGYGLIRFLTEFIRIDPTPVYFGLKLPQIASIFLIIAGVWLISRYFKGFHELDKLRDM